MKRTITVANTKTQTRKVFESEATTLGELKKELDAQGIDYDGMSFTEGISKTVLTEDASILPSNLLHKGQRTNDLVILLTNTQKKIASGIDRKEAYEIIKSQNLSEKVRSHFGKSYTNVSTVELVAFVDKCKAKAPASSPAPTNKVASEECPKTRQEILDWFFDGVRTFVSNNLLQIKDVEALGDRLIGFASNGGATSVVTDKDIDDMIAHMRH